MNSNPTPPFRLGSLAYRPIEGPHTHCYICLTATEAGDPVVILADAASNRGAHVSALAGELATAILAGLPDLAHRHPHTILWYTTVWLAAIEGGADRGPSAASLERIEFRLVASDTGGGPYSVSLPLRAPVARGDADALLAGLEAAYWRISRAADRSRAR